jgi:hypothetical protein
MSAKLAIRGHFMNLVCDTLDRPLRLVNLTGPSTAKGDVRRSNLNEHSMPEQKCQDLLHLFRLNAKPAVQAVVNYVSFCHTCLHKIQR